MNVDNIMSYIIISNANVSDANLALGYLAHYLYLWLIAVTLFSDAQSRLKPLRIMLT